jgi:outer membrane usher protein FimD/PapC
MGELRSPGFGNQPGIPLRGISISRNFDLDPYDPPFPGLLAPLLLEQASEIEVRVGQRVVDRFRLPAGPVLISDFPLGTGFNDVDVLVLDDGRVTDQLRLDGWFDRSRLGAGRQRFHFSVGQPWRQGPTSPQRSSSRLSASGAFETGVTDRLTLGSGMIYDGEARQLNAELQGSLGFRSFALRASVLSSVRQSQAAPALSVGLDAYPGSGTWQWQTSALWRADDFIPFGIEQAPGRLFNLQSRLSRSLGQRWRFGLSHRYRNEREASGHGLRSTLAFRANSSLSVQLAADAELDNGTSNDYGINLFLTWRPRSGPHTLYAGTDDGSNWQAGWQMNRQSSHGGSSYGLFLNEDESGTNYSGDARFRSHRGTIQFSHFGALGESASQTRVAADTALVYADGHFGIADRVGQAFALFAGREDSGAVYINPSVDDWRSRSDMLGNAVVGDLTPYLERGFSIGLPDLPVRVDPGDLQPVVQPEFLRGIVVPIGPVPSTDLRFRLLDRNGAALALASGKLIRLDDSSVQLFFSNRDGAVQITGVVPGDYRVELRDGRVLLERLTIDVQADTTDLGEIRT